VTADQFAFEHLLAGAGACGPLALSRDWDATPLGPMSSWPENLRTAVGIIERSPIPMALGWGPGLVQLYNDGFVPILAEKHPAAMGRGAHENWAEIWEFIGPMLEGVVLRGDTTLQDSQRLLLDRNGHLEEGFFTFSFSPIGEVGGQAGGFLCVAIETTEVVVAGRRSSALGRLAELGRDARSLADVSAGVLGVLADNPDDVPFAALYALSQDGTRAALAGSTGLTEADLAAELQVGSDLDCWRLSEVAPSGQPVTVGHPLGQALVLPLSDPAQPAPTGVLVLALNPLLPHDDGHHAFLSQVAGHVGTALAAARARQAERARLEALAELDRAKTEFFSNVSHEFRTPLTLLLGPLYEALEDADLSPLQRDRLESAARNAQRLLKLVNTLLDISKAEGGAQEAAFEPTDLAQLTVDLASGFASAASRARLDLRVDCPPLPEEVYVDREMWEKVVLNLLSNAFKFTLDGAISVTLGVRDGQAELRVSDTGIGIPDSELPRLFERFHRVHGARGRSHEGTGLGLSLARDLVALHGGDLTVESRLGEGSAFTVRLPFGSSHLPREQVHASASPLSLRLSPATFLDEPASLTSHPAPQAHGGSRILLAEDNADMRAFLERLLRPHWDVQVVSDGVEALEAATAAPPDLVLTDVMMPGLDGFGLLKALRAQPATQDVPVVMVSARAGDEATEEALAAGADDYLVKPFKQRQLLARVRLQLNLAQARREVTEAAIRAVQEAAGRREAARFASLARATTDFVCLTDPSGTILHVNPGGRRMLGLGPADELDGVSLADLISATSRTDFTSVAVPTAVRTGVWRGDTALRHQDGQEIPTSFVLIAHRDDDGKVAFLATTARDTSEERRIAELLSDAEGRFRHAFEDAPVGMAILDDALEIQRVNPELCALLRRTPDKLVPADLLGHVHPDDRESTSRFLQQLTQERSTSLTWEVRMLRGDGTPVAATLSASLTQRRHGRRQVLLHVQDITERHALESQLRHLADHDPLTGLLNRRRLMEQLEREVAAVQRYGGSGALLVLDLDDFKYVNDSLGHAAGDELILRTTQQLSQRLRETDTLARLGGDEFAVILPHVDEQQAREVAADLLDALWHGGMIVNRTGARRLSASIGIALFDQRRAQLPPGDELLIEADTAMYDAKEAGRARVAVFDPTNARQLGMEVRLDVAERLREALDNGRLLLYAQPIVDLRAEPTRHYELLVRIREEDGTVLPPAAFLDVAERFQLIRVIDRWVISEALRLLAAVRAQGRRVTLSVNLSVQSILDPELPDWIAAAIADSAVDGHDLVFEVTETDAAVNFERANQLTRRLKELGCGFALDDFGTGYCSLRYLKHLSFDYLKIDAEFVTGLASGSPDRLIVRAAVQIARGLGKRTIAEGVEDGETLALLAGYGVDFAQGFYLAHPGPADEVLLSAEPCGIPLARRPSDAAEQPR
jgi:diguanylate cyclase (GGDEF)-like protein/PAS domain S-box-containing protein